MAPSALLAYTPVSGDLQKHTFLTEYIESDDRKDHSRVAFVDMVTTAAHDGQHVAIAKRDIERGELIEKGILRLVDGLSGSTPNPHVLRLGQDFELSSTKRPVGCPFIASGTLMLYGKAVDTYNVELAVHTPVGHADDAHEFVVVAAEHIPAGAPLVRKVAQFSGEEAPVRYADVYHLSEEDVERYLDFRAELDKKVADKAGVAPDMLHADAIREHVQLTNEGRLPIVECSKTVVLPHPSWGGYGTFATEDIAAGEIVEWGLHRRIDGLHGDSCPFVFTWNSSGERNPDGNMWAMGTGDVGFMNSDVPANARVYRLYGAYRYVIVAKRDIRKGEEVMHLYVSSSWRKCFAEDENLPKLLPIDNMTGMIQKVQ